MHFFILGGSGRTGSIIIDEATARGHTVAALVRNPSKVQEKANVKYIKGDSTSATDVARISETSRIDAVLVALSGDGDNPFAKSTSSPRLISDSVQNAVNAMKQHGVKKIVVMQAFGVESSYKNLNFIMRFIISHSEMSKQFNDHNTTAREIREACKDGSFQWTLVRPPMLKGEEFLPVKVLGDDGKGSKFMPQCSRKSVARFMVERCAESSEFDGRTPVICN